MNELISLEKAISIIREALSSSNLIQENETLDITSSLGRVTAFDYFSDIDFPPFDKSAMDGYVVSNPDLDEYQIIGTIKAGEINDKELKDNECFLIMTGAPVNRNGKKVIIKEDTDVIGDKIVLKKKSNSINIAYKGEDLKKGDISLRRNTVITPFSIGSLANSGISKVAVYRKIEIAIAVTGDELIDIEQTPFAGKTRDINTYTLLGRIKSIPFCCVENYGVIKDTLETTKATINKFIESKKNILILSGGSSKGDFDFVTKALDELGIKILFEGVKVQPGKPVIFAKFGDKVIFGLPGNPVSVLLAFEIFVKEALYSLYNIQYKPVVFSATIDDNFIRKNTERTLFFPVLIEYTDNDIIAVPVRYNGSGHINSYNNISFMGIIKEGIKEIKKGDKILVRVIGQNY